MSFGDFVCLVESAILVHFEGHGLRLRPRLVVFPGGFTAELAILNDRTTVRGNIITHFQIAPRVIWMPTSRVSEVVGPLGSVVCGTSVGAIIHDGTICIARDWILIVWSIGIGPDWINDTPVFSMDPTIDHGSLSQC